VQPSGQERSPQATHGAPIEMLRGECQLLQRVGVLLHLAVKG
jgi:hypothetical protein